MGPQECFWFFTFFLKKRTPYKSNYIIFILSWCGTHTKIRSKLVDIVTAGLQKITLWGPQGTPLGLLRVKYKCRLTVSLFSSVCKGILCGRYKGLPARRFMSPVKLNLATSFTPHALPTGETSGLLIVRIGAFVDVAAGVHFVGEKEKSCSCWESKATLHSVKLSDFTVWRHTWRKKRSKLCSFDRQ